MNKSYFLIPCALLGFFALYHHGAVQRSQEKEQAAALLAAQKKAALDLRRAEVQRATFEQSRLQAATREQQERERLEKKRADYDALMAKLEADASARTAEAERLAAEIEQNCHTLTELRAQKAGLAHATAEAERTTELRRIERRAADMETQLAAARLFGRVDEMLRTNQGRF
jgi:hypothetical protein